MPTFLVQRAAKKKDVPGKHGPMQVISLALNTPGTDEVVGAEWFTKAETPIPVAGSSMDFELEKTEYGLKAKRPQQAGGFGGGPRGRSPEETKAIVRQHSQEMALRYAAIRAGQGKLPEDFKLSDLSKIVDYFVRDAAA